LPGGSLISSDAVADTKKNRMIRERAMQSYEQGAKLGNSYLDRQALAYLNEMGLKPGQPISPDAMRAGSAAGRMLAPSPAFGGKDMLTHLEDLIKATPDDKLGNLWSNYDFVKSKILGRTGDPQLDELLAQFNSVYAIGATVHGWRGYKAPEQLQKAFGDIRRGKASVLATLEDLRGAAQSAVFVATHPLNTTGVGGQGKGTPDSPIVIKPEDIK
jgi:hypothetical protein